MVWWRWWWVPHAPREGSISSIDDIIWSMCDRTVSSARPFGVEAMADMCMVWYGLALACVETKSVLKPTEIKEDSRMVMTKLKVVKRFELAEEPPRNTAHRPAACGAAVAETSAWPSTERGRR